MFPLIVFVKTVAPWLLYVHITFAKIFDLLTFHLKQ